MWRIVWMVSACLSLAGCESDISVGETSQGICVEEKIDSVDFSDRAMSEECIESIKVDWHLDESMPSSDGITWDSFETDDPDVWRTRTGSILASARSLLESELDDHGLDLGKTRADDPGIQLYNYVATNVDSITVAEWNGELANTYRNQIVVQSPLSQELMGSAQMVHEARHSDRGQHRHRICSFDVTDECDENMEGGYGYQIAVLLSGAHLTWQYELAAEGLLVHIDP